MLLMQADSVPARLLLVAIVFCQLGDCGVLADLKYFASLTFSRTAFLLVFNAVFRFYIVLQMRPKGKRTDWHHSKHIVAC